MLFSPTSDDAVAAVRRGGAENRSVQIAGVLEEASAWKPGGAVVYNAAVRKRRDYSLGRQLPHATSVLERYFPKTHGKMVPHVVGFFRHLVDQLATLYRTAPNRDVLVGGEKDRAASKLAREVYRAGRVDVEMRGAERAATAAGVCFVRVGWDPFGERIYLSRFWPDRVAVVPDPDFADDLSRARFLIAEVLDDRGLAVDAKSKPVEVWARQEDSWRRIMARTDGARWEPLELGGQTEYPFLPWFAVRYCDPGGRMFPDLPTDDLATADSLTAGATNRDHIIALQAHAQRYVSGVPAEDGAEFRTGPDEIWELATGEVGQLQSNPPLGAVDAALQGTLERELLLRGVSPAQATADPKYMAALALRVINQTRDERREERIPYARQTEEGEMWTAIRAVVEHYSAIRFPEGAEMSVAFGPLATPLDEEADWRLSFELVDRGVSTLPREMVKHNAAPNEDEALELLEENARRNAEVRELAGDEPAEEKPEEQAAPEEAAPAPAEAPEVEADPEEAVAPDTALNGAQVTALLDIVAQVAQRQIPRETGVAMIEGAFPLTKAQADALLGEVGRSFFVEEEEKPPPPFAAPSGPPDDQG